MGTINWKHISLFKEDGKIMMILKIYSHFFYVGGEFSMIFFIATFLFVVCAISTVTSIREEPLAAVPSSCDNATTGNSNDDDDDEMQTEIEVDENRPLLSPRRNTSRSYHSSTRRTRPTANVYLSDWNKQEGFLEIDLATGGRIPHDHVMDSFNLSPTRKLEFDSELQRKAKLIKLGTHTFSKLLHIIFYSSSF